MAPRVSFAIQYLEEHLSESTNSDVVRQAQAALWLQAGRPDRALQCTQSPFQRCLLQLFVGNLAAASEEIQYCHSVEQRLQLQALLLQANGNLEDAESAYRAMTSPVASNNLAYLLASTHRWEEAYALLDSLPSNSRSRPSQTLLEVLRGMLLSPSATT